MSNHTVICVVCSMKKDFGYLSKLDRIDVNNYCCSMCRKKRSIENRMRNCPACKNQIIYKSPSKKCKAEKINSICKNCRSNQIPHTFTQEQKEFIIGLMLGDGCIQYGGRHTSYPRLTVNRQIIDRDYLFWQYELFDGFYGTEPKEYVSYHNKVKKSYHGYGCATKSGQLFLDYHIKWYKDGKKCIPRDIELTPLTMLVWFLDDGCVIRNGKAAFTLKISTDGFHKDDVIYLSDILSSFLDTNINMYRNGNGWILKANTLAVAKLIRIIDPIFPKCMERKRTWAGFDFTGVEDNCKHQSRKNDPI